MHYSVYSSVIGRRIDVAADLTRVRILREGRRVADPERIWVKHQAITDPEHLAAAQALRRGSEAGALGARGRRLRSNAWPTTTLPWA